MGKVEAEGGWGALHSHGGTRLAAHTLQGLGGRYLHCSAVYPHELSSDFPVETCPGGSRAHSRPLTRSDVQRQLDQSSREKVSLFSEENAECWKQAGEFWQPHCGRD